MRVGILPLLLLVFACVSCRDGMSIVAGHPGLTKTDRFTRSGFSCYESEEGLWVFRTGSPDHHAFCQEGPDDKSYKAIGEGPGGRNLISLNKTTVIEFLGTRPGFMAVSRDEALWIWREGDPIGKDILAGACDEKCFTAIGDGPLGINLKADDAATLLAYTVAKDGFQAFVLGKDIWIARTGSKAAAALAKGEEDEKCATLIGEGPGGRNLKAYEREDLIAWEIAKDDFATYLDAAANKIWVFVPGSKGQMEYQEKGPLEVHAALIGEGPGGRTVCSDELAIAKEYVASQR